MWYLSTDVKVYAWYFENDNESYRTIACNLSSDVNEVSRDKILHRSMLIATVSRDDIFTSLILFCFIPTSIYHQFWNKQPTIPFNSSLRDSTTWDKNEKYMMDEENEIQQTTTS